MPQFDISSYSSQIFWFIICFAVLYFFMSKIILPRITAILKERKFAIDSDVNSAKTVEHKLEALQTKTDLLRQQANETYQSKIDETIKNTAKQREIMISDLKDKIDSLAKKSRQELQKFAQDSEAKNESVITNLVQAIKEKVFGKELSSDLSNNKN